MCNIAGYVGERDAAPILIEMLRREEGFAGGFYSGIATLHEGKLYSAKLTGDLDRLLALTEAAKLPGKIGIIHSRSRSGGGDEWAHPFLSQANGVGEYDCAYVANGSQGCFSSLRERFSEKAEALTRQGYVMRSRDRLEATGYPTMRDGTCVHMSDLMCAAIQREIDGGMTPPAAMEAAFCEIPSEIVGLLLHRATPNEIHWSRINMPMFVGFAPHGAYLASSALAFPADAGEEMLLPAQASGSVTAKRYTVIPYAAPVGRAGRTTAAIAARAYETVRGLLAEGEKRFYELYRPVSKLYGACDYTDAEPLTYQILQAIASEGALSVQNRPVPGVLAGTTAPQTVFSLKQ